MTSRRARPLSREERRAAIATATVPLLVERGATVTTREIAQAAGVAEGTLFRVFADKNELLRTAMIAATDPQQVLDELAALCGRDVSLERMLTDVVEILVSKARTAMSVMSAAHQLLALGGDDRPHAGPMHGPGTHRGPHGGPGGPMKNALVKGVGACLAPYTEHLRITPIQAAHLLTAIVFGNSMAKSFGHSDIDQSTIVDVFTRGAVRDPAGGPRPG